MDLKVVFIIHVYSSVCEALCSTGSSVADGFDTLVIDIDNHLYQTTLEMESFNGPLTPYVPLIDVDMSPDGWLIGVTVGYELVHMMSLENGMWSNPIPGSASVISACIGEQELIFGVTANNQLRVRNGVQSSWSLAAYGYAEQVIQITATTMLFGLTPNSLLYFDQPTGSWIDTGVDFGSNVMVDISFIDSENIVPVIADICVIAVCYIGQQTSSQLSEPSQSNEESSSTNYEKTTLLVGNDNNLYTRDRRGSVSLVPYTNGIIDIVVMSVMVLKYTMDDQGWTEIVPNSCCVISVDITGNFIIGVGIDKYLYTKDTLDGVWNGPVADSGFVQKVIAFNEGQQIILAVDAHGVIVMPSGSVPFWQDAEFNVIVKDAMVLPSGSLDPILHDDLLFQAICYGKLPDSSTGMDSSEGSGISDGSSNSDNSDGSVDSGSTGISDGSAKSSSTSSFDRIYPATDPDTAVAMPGAPHSASHYITGELDQCNVIAVGKDGYLYTGVSMGDHAYQYHGPIHGSCCVIDIASLPDKTLVGVQKDNRLYVKSNLVEGSWIRSYTDSCCIVSVDVLPDGEIIAASIEDVLLIRSSINAEWDLTIPIGMHIAKLTLIPNSFDIIGISEDSTLIIHTDGMWKTLDNDLFVLPITDLAVDEDGNYGALVPGMSELSNGDQIHIVSIAYVDLPLQDYMGSPQTIDDQDFSTTGTSKVEHGFISSENSGSGTSTKIVMPVIIVAILIAGCIGVYYYRRKHYEKMEKATNKKERSYVSVVMKLLVAVFCFQLLMTMSVVKPITGSIGSSVADGIDTLVISTDYQLYQTTLEIKSFIGPLTPNVPLIDVDMSPDGWLIGVTVDYELVHMLSLENAVWSNPIPGSARVISACVDELGYIFGITATKTLKRRFDVQSAWSIVANGYAEQVIKITVNTMLYGITRNSLLYFDQSGSWIDTGTDFGGNAITDIAFVNSELFVQVVETIELIAICYIGQQQSSQPNGGSSSTSVGSAGSSVEDGIDTLLIYTNNQLYQTTLEMKSFIGPLTPNVPLIDIDMSPDGWLIGVTVGYELVYMLSWENAVWSNPIPGSASVISACVDEQGYIFGITATKTLKRRIDLRSAWSIVANGYVEQVIKLTVNTMLFGLTPNSLLYFDEPAGSWINTGIDFGDSVLVDIAFVDSDVLAPLEANNEMIAICYIGQQTSSQSNTVETALLVGDDNNLYTRDEIGSVSLVPYTNGIIDIVFMGDDSLLAVNTNNEMVLKYIMDDQGWTEIVPNSCCVISVDIKDSLIIGVGIDNHLYTKNKLNDVWNGPVADSGFVQKVVIYSEGVYNTILAVDTNGVIVITSSGSIPFWQDAGINENVKDFTVVSSGLFDQIMHDDHFFQAICYGELPDSFTAMGSSRGSGSSGESSNAGSPGSTGGSIDSGSDGSSGGNVDSGSAGGSGGSVESSLAGNSDRLDAATEDSHTSVAMPGAPYSASHYIIGEMDQSNVIAVGEDGYLYTGIPMGDYAYQYHGPIHGSCCVIDIASLPDKTLVGVQEDNRLYVKSNLEEGSWIRSYTDSCCIVSVDVLLDGEIIAASIADVVLIRSSINAEWDLTIPIGMHIAKLTLIPNSFDIIGISEDSTLIIHTDGVWKTLDNDLFVLPITDLTVDEEGNYGALVPGMSELSNGDQIHIVSIAHVDFPLQDYKGSPQTIDYQDISTSGTFNGKHGSISSENSGLGTATKIVLPLIIIALLIAGCIGVYYYRTKHLWLGTP
uniref:Uncharacterized protein LOC102801082 n=1 Tax=Saccoglossus kowalevskii TaxID=10224 RepID=A0ABM0MAD9_SACKO|nr:PREDICTED: uncharacterized protein LOC102801082 [Saccoglossus kowalevskii]